MLHTEAPFPYVSAAAYLVPSGDPLRIVRRNLDGTVLVGRTDRAPAQRRASDNFTVPLEQLRATPLEAYEAGGAQSRAAGRADRAALRRAPRTRTRARKAAASC